jgi:hypothetical protein
LFCDAIECVFQRSLTGHIDRDTFGRLNVKHRHTCARALEHACGGGTDAFRAAGDDGGLAADVMPVQKNTFA